MQLGETILPYTLLALQTCDLNRQLFVAHAEAVMVLPFWGACAVHMLYKMRHTDDNGVAPEQPYLWLGTARDFLGCRIGVASQTRCAACRGSRPAQYS